MMMNNKRTTSATAKGNLKRYPPNNEDINLANYDPLKQDIEKMRHNNGNFIIIEWFLLCSSF